ncbi:MAG: hypothetical protein MUC39_06240 [Candidatus Omnitrophica bacterium]|jgi:hypothetical protein|nr:hypothetical protein [Candidatus Omnitrophota bacterium]
MNLPKFRLEFILNTFNAEAEVIKNALMEFGIELEINPSGESGRDFLVHIISEDPTMVFDVCGQFGRIKSMKVEES